MNASAIKLKNDEKGFISTFILVVFLVFFLSVSAFILGLGFGVMKQAQAKYGWFCEAVNFSVEAANMASDPGSPEVSRNAAEAYFCSAMERFGLDDYELVKFAAVEPGDPIPHGTAEAPGFLAEIKMPVSVVSLRLVISPVGSSESSTFILLESLSAECPVVSSEGSSHGSSEDSPVGFLDNSPVDCSVDLTVDSPVDLSVDFTVGYTVESTAGFAVQSPKGLHFFI